MIDLRHEFPSHDFTDKRLRDLRRVMRAGDISAIRQIVTDGLLGDDAVTGARGARTVAVTGRLRSILLVSCSPLYRAKSLTNGELLAHGFIEAIRFGVFAACPFFVGAGADFKNPRLRRRLIEVVRLHTEGLIERLTVLRELRHAGVVSLSESDFTMITPIEATTLHRFGEMSPDETR